MIVPCSGISEIIKEAGGGGEGRGQQHFGVNIHRQKRHRLDAGCGSWCLLGEFWLRTSNIKAREFSQRP